MRVLIVLILINIAPSTGRKYASLQIIDKHSQESRLVHDQIQRSNQGGSLHPQRRVDRKHVEHHTNTYQYSKIGKQRPVNRTGRAGGMISQMSLGFQAFSDKTMMYGPGPGNNYNANGQGMGMSSMTSANVPGSNYGGSVQGMGISSITSGNAPGSNYGGSGQGMGMSSGPFTNKGMSQSMFPAGLSNNKGGIPNGLSQGNSGMSPFGGSSSMKEGSNRTPFNMAMLSMQSQAELSPSMGGAISMNGRQPARGSSSNVQSRENSDRLDQKITFGDTTSIQYVDGRIIVPRTWSMEKVRALQAKINGDDVHGKNHLGCPQPSSNCPKSCIVFNENGCPVCSCEEDICPVFPAGCRKGRVRINKDGCPVCVSDDKPGDWYNTIWNNDN